MRVISANLNGIRSAWKKGFAQWLAGQQADAVCTQEVRATLKDMAKDGTMENPAGLTGYWHLAERPGYSGVGIWSAHIPTQITQGIGHPDFDAEGRYLELDL
ncbi:MAG: exodeoxyribonuclease, partial [Pseudomonadota bacterium]